MHESDGLFPRESAVLYEFLDRCRPLVDEPKPYMFDFPKAIIEQLEERVKNGLALALAGHDYFKLETLVKKRVYHEVVSDRIANERSAQARAKYRRTLSGQESQIRYVDAERIRRETEKELNDLWCESMEHQAAL